MDKTNERGYYHIIETEYIERTSYLGISVLALSIIAWLNTKGFMGINKAVFIGAIAAVIMIYASYRLFDRYFYIFHESIIEEGESGISYKSRYPNIIGTFVGREVTFNDIKDYKVGWRWIKIKGNFTVDRKTNYDIFVQGRRKSKSIKSIKIPIYFDNTKQKLSNYEVIKILDRYKIRR